MSKLTTIYGLHAIQAALKTSAQRVQDLYVYQGRRDQKIQKVVDAAKRNDITIHFVDKKALDEFVDGNHQGVVATIEGGKTYQEQDLYPLVENLEGTPFILVLDGVTDPHNLGACLRSADAAGVHALVIPKDNSVGVNDTVRKVASGAAETVPVIPVTNLVRCLKKLQELGLWVTGLAGEAEDLVYNSDLTGPRVIVMGAEGDGMRRLTRETCDSLVKIPMEGTVSSLNVSVATGIVLFETLRQRGLSDL
ncbi:MAG: 23S rRNA (guanosine(2251)-2'-O)-methyltransferase RlmB [Agarilytica sp.]